MQWIFGCIFSLFVLVDIMYSYSNISNSYSCLVTTFCSSPSVRSQHYLKLPVQFKPSTAGEHTGLLLIQSQASGSLVIQLTGEALPWIHHFYHPTPPPHAAWLRVEAPLCALHCGREESDREEKAKELRIKWWQCWIRILLLPSCLEMCTVADWVGLTETPANTVPAASG